MALEDIRALVGDDITAVNELILNKIHTQIGLIDELGQYIIESGGKRLRPLIVLLASKACGYQGRNHIDLAAMIEYFHTATLLHDDVVDDSSLRRGRMTANEIWGSKASILVGDYLYTQSILLLVGLNESDILTLMASTAHTITCGEVKQLANRHNTCPNVDDYYEIIRAKTAVLFAASASIGGLISNASLEVCDALYSYGLHLGNAFQLIDDALDYCADASTLGKNIGDDLADGKATLPLIYALEHGTNQQKTIIQESLSKGSLEHLTEIQQAIDETKAIIYTQEAAKHETEKALLALEIVPNSPFKDALIELAHMALARGY